MSKVFEYVIIYVPVLTKEMQDKGEKPKAIMLTEGVQTILANDVAQANMIAVRAIPKDYEDQLEQVQVVVRPF